MGVKTPKPIHKKARVEILAYEKPKQKDIYLLHMEGNFSFGIFSISLSFKIVVALVMAQLKF